MPVGREAAPIIADLGHDDPGAEVADPGDRGQDGERRAKGLDRGVDLLVDLRNRRVDGIDLLRLVDLLHEFTGQFQANIITKHLDNIFVAANGQVSSTRLEQDIKIWRLKTAAASSVWWLQNPSKTFEALTSASLTTEY